MKIIYKITNKKGNPLYVGITSNFKKRVESHKFGVANPNHHTLNESQQGLYNKLTKGDELKYVPITSGNYTTTDETDYINALEPGYNRLQVHTKESSEGVEEGTLEQDQFINDYLRGANG